MGNMVYSPHYGVVQDFFHQPYLHHPEEAWRCIPSSPRRCDPKARRGVMFRTLGLGFRVYRVYRVPRPPGASRK